MSAMPSKDARQSLRLGRWRGPGERLDADSSAHVERRRAEDRIREERHDACAKTIYAAKPVEQRQRPSEARLRARREEQKRQWDARSSRP